MTESGGRRIKRALYLDLNTIRFCDAEMIGRFQGIGLIQDFVAARLADVEAEGGQDEACNRDVCAEHELTNVGVFRAYMTAYLGSREDLHRDDMTLLVRQLDPSPMGLPLEVYAFTKTTAWEEYEAIQAEIFEHLVAAAPAFGLKVFQQPSGADFQVLVDPA
jgi:miniconductance mechanosensitive channel